MPSAARAPSAGDGGQRDQRESEAIERLRKPVVGFREIGAADARIDVRIGPEKLAEVTLVGGAAGDAGGAGELIEIKNVALELEPRKMRPAFGAFI